MRDNGVNFFNKILIPEKIIKKGKVFQIEFIDESLFINGFSIEFKNRCFHKVFLEGSHPNCDPKTNEYCLDENFIGLPFSFKNLKRIENRIKIYYLDEAYFQPYSHLLKAKEIPSLKIKI